MDIQELEKNIEVVVNLLKALSNEKRLILICALYDGEKSFGELAEISELSQSALSQHLTRLRADGLINRRRDMSDRNAYYTLNSRAIEAILKSLYDVCLPDP